MLNGWKGICTYSVNRTHYVRQQFNIPELACLLTVLLTVELCELVAVRWPSPVATPSISLRQTSSPDKI